MSVIAVSRVFVARAGKHGEDEDLALDSGLAIVGFKTVPSLAPAKDTAAVLKLVEAALPEAKPRTLVNFAGQLWTFAAGMKIGDIVVMPRKQTSQIAVGRVVGDYEFRKVQGELRHTRKVDWIRPDVPRTAFEQDLLYSFGAFLTVCNITRNNAETRVAAVLAGGKDPGPNSSGGKGSPVKQIGAGALSDQNLIQAVEEPDLSQLAHDQITRHIQARFAGHGLATLVDAVLQADGWVTKVSPPGADGGVDILGGRGPLGLDGPRLCVQVKSQTAAADVTTYRTLQGSMQTYKAQQGLLVCWGGFNKPVLSEAKQGHFDVRLWDSGDLVAAIYRNYERLPAEIQADLPLKHVWMLVPESESE